MPLPLAVAAAVPAIKLIVAGVALGVLAVKLSKTHEGVSIKRWFDKKRAPGTPGDVNSYLKKFHGIDTEILLAVLIQMQAILDRENIKLNSETDIYNLIKRALAQSKVKYTEIQQKNIIAVILDIYRTITPAIDGFLYNYLRGGQTKTEQSLDQIKSGITSASKTFNIKKYLMIGGALAGAFVFMKYVYPKLKRKS
jgi:hypothetical protein